MKVPETRFARVPGWVGAFLGATVLVAALWWGSAGALAQGPTGSQGSPGAQGTTGASAPGPGAAGQPNPSPGATGPGSLYPHLPKPIRQSGRGRGEVPRRARGRGRRRSSPGRPAPLTRTPPVRAAPSTGRTERAEDPAARTRAGGPLPATGDEVWLVGLVGAGLLLSGIGSFLRARAASVEDRPF